MIYNHMTLWLLIWNFKYKIDTIPDWFILNQLAISAVHRITAPQCIWCAGSESAICMCPCCRPLKREPETKLFVCYQGFYYATFCWVVTLAGINLQFIEFAGLCAVHVFMGHTSSIKCGGVLYWENWKRICFE